jgi:hypothetical protein
MHLRHHPDPSTRLFKTPTFNRFTILTFTTRQIYTLILYPSILPHTYPFVLINLQNAYIRKLSSINPRIDQPSEWDQLKRLVMIIRRRIVRLTWCSSCCWCCCCCGRRCCNKIWIWCKNAISHMGNDSERMSIEHTWPIWTRDMRMRAVHMVVIITECECG